MTLDCFIIDDDYGIIEHITKFVKKTPDLNLIGTETEASNVLDQFMNHTLQPDILFLDISMPEVTGLELIEVLPRDISVIFVTGHTKYAVNAFDNAAVDYLVKPVKYSRFLAAINKVREKVSNKKTVEEPTHTYFIQTKIKGHFSRLDYRTVYFIESQKNYLDIHTDQDTMSIYMTIKDLLKKLPEKQFIQVHRSYVVNLEKIKEVTGGKIIMENHEEIKIGMHYKKKILELIHAALLQTSRKR